MDTVEFVDPEQRHPAIDILSDINPRAIVIDGHDSAITGIAERRPGSLPVLVYSIGTIRKNLVATSDMDYQDAEDYIDYNILPLSDMDHGPIIVSFFQEITEEVDSDSCHDEKGSCEEE